MGVYNDVEIFIRAKFFADEGAENIFEDAHHSRAVNIFSGFKFREGIYQIHHKAAL